jgi:hypothetical protein
MYTYYLAESRIFEGKLFFYRHNKITNNWECLGCTNEKIMQISLRKLNVEKPSDRRLKKIEKFQLIEYLNKDCFSHKKEEIQKFIHSTILSFENLSNSIEKLIEKLENHEFL